MKKRILLSLIVTLAAFTVSVKAEVVGFNVSGGWGNPSMEGRTADGCSTWTDVASNNGSGQVLNGTDGLVTVDWSSNNIWWAGSEDEEEDKPYRIYLDDGGNGVDITINGLGDWLDSIGASGCVIRVYQCSDGHYGEFKDIEILNENGLLEVVKAQNVWDHDGGGERGTCDAATMLYSNTINLDFSPRADGEPRSTMGAFKISTVSEFYATRPSPDNLTETSIDQDVSWVQAADANGQGVTYNVYFGTDPNELSPTYYGLNPVKITTDDVTDFFYDPGTLDNSTEYYWKVDSIVPGDGVYEGYEWKFETQPPSARVEVGPESKTVPAGTAEVQLIVDAINTTSYQWYKNDQALADDPTDTEYSGEDTATLTIYDVQLDDEASYYCVVDNSLVQPDQSNSARILIQRMMGWWKLDNDLTDSVNEEVPGVLFFDGVSVDPNYVAEGIDGAAIEFYGDDNSLVSIPGSADYYNFYQQGYTASVWVKNTQANGWAAYISKQRRETEPWQGYFLAQNGGVPVQGLRQSGDTADLYGNVDVDQDSWHLVTGVFDAENDMVKIYVDGVLRNERETTQEPEANDFDMIFGAELPDASVSPYDGLLDDVRIWNYPLDSVAIAQLYVEFNPGSKVCVENPAMDISGPEGERDCIVDLFDITAIASQWLDCNIVPDCLQ